MCAAKKKDSPSSAPTWLSRLFAWLLGAGRPVLIGVLLLGAFGGGSYLAWLKLKPSILAAPEYRIGPEQVEITPPPAWIHRDLRMDVFRDPALDGRLSLMDDDLTERIFRAFAAQPWVAKVGGVTKRYPASLKVELVYRQPVCMVEVPGGVLAVDAEGVLLPSEDFSPVEATRYPRLVGVDRNPPGPAGRRWGDAKVVGGSEIAAALSPVWEIMKLQRIEPLAGDPTAVGGDSGRRYLEPMFALYTRSGTRILWGYAPGANVLGETSAAEKVARLKQYLADHDTLDGPQGKPQELDVRTMGKGASSLR